VSPSNLADRVDLMKRVLRVIDAASIRALLADREFIGHQWFDFLIDNGIPFAICAFRKNGTANPLIRGQLFR
jgi:hypothetical protein